MKLNKKKENRIFSKQFVTTEPTKYGLKFSVLSIIIKRKKTYWEMSFFEVKEKKVMLKKENKIFSKQFVTMELIKYGLRKKTF